jgi:Flp pilus assembly protein TadD
MVIKLDASNTNAYYARAAAYDNLGQYEKAVSDYRKALDLA